MRNIQITLLVLCLSLSGCNELASRISKSSDGSDVQQAPDLLSIEKLRKITQGSHTDTLNVEALKIFPKARKYEMKMTNTRPDGQEASIEMLPTEKWVDGKYVVSEVEMPEGVGQMAMIVEYHEESQTYRKYIVINDELISVIIGLRVGDTRSISWIDLIPDKYSTKKDMLSYETHTDDKTVWKAIYLKGTVLQWTEVGEAKVIE